MRTLNARQAATALSSQVSCCCFDLETTNLSADFGVILCGVVKPAHAEARIFRADRLNRNWHKRRSDDRAIVLAIVAELSQYDIWVAHNGARFDVPFLRTRMLRWAMDPLPAKKLIDPVLLARNKLRMSYNGLEQVANHLGCNSKTEVLPEAWLRAALDGDSKSMNYIVKHCVQDVLVLERVIGALKAYSGTYNTWGSGF
jgi:uncharacterized protein YprB with RNaseH-like and TPR domain